MPAAASKAELLEKTRREYDKLLRVIDGFPEALRLERDAAETSPKDIIAHRAHWIVLFLGWHRDGVAGKSPEIPAPGYKWNQLKSYNAALRAAQSEITWEEARSMLDTGRRDAGPRPRGPAITGRRRSICGPGSARLRADARPAPPRRATVRYRAAHRR